MIPAAGGVTIDDNDILILDDDIPDVWLIETELSKLRLELTHLR